MTGRLYYDDSYLTEFSARVVEEAGTRLILDRTAFYPASGGQPCDRGTINGVAVLGVMEDGERIVHTMAGPVAGASVQGRIDWERRFDHMQQHSGQHLLSAVIAGDLRIPTVSFHLGEESSTIDIAAASLNPAQIRAMELRANAVIAENRAVTVEYRDASAQDGLRAPSSRQGTLRVIRIEDLDASACGGTHVRRTGEIGCLLVRRLEKVRGNLRIEFLCGVRAVRRARADFDALTRIAHTLDTALDAAPELVAAQQARLKDLDKNCRRLAVELARRRGRELYEATPVAPSGLRVYENTSQSGPLDEATRAEAQAFTASPGAVYLAASRQPAALLLSVSAGVQLDAGAILKQVLSEVGGRGGGNAAMAQGSAPDGEALEVALEAIRRRLHASEAGVRLRRQP